MRIYLAFILLFLYSFCIQVYGQAVEYEKTKSLEFYSEKEVEALSENGQDEIQDDALMLTQKPINLNSIETDILCQTNLLNTEQVTELKKHIQKFGPLIEPEELQQINGFTKDVIEKILLYSYVASYTSIEPSQQITFRIQNKTGNSETGYLGSKEKILIKYKGVLSHKVSLAYTGEKDSGEKLFKNGKYSLDHNSFYMVYSGSTFIKKIILGDFLVQEGQGLTIWQGLSLGGNSLTGIFKFGRGIIPNAGNDENRFFRGLAVTVAKRKLTFDLWISKHKIDATLQTDTLIGQTGITSIVYHGYHRTESENRSYHTLTELCAGATVKYAHKNLNIGIANLYGNFDKPVLSKDQEYNRFAFTGSNFSNNGLNHSYTYKNLFLFGEISLDRNFTLAFNQGLLISLSDKLSVGILHRNYPKQYEGLKSNAYGVNTINNNERGTYLGFSYKLNKNIQYYTHIDLYSFGFIKYRVDAPSKGLNYQNHIDIALAKKLNVQLQHRQKLSEQNDTKSENAAGSHISKNWINQYRLSCRFKLDNTWEIASRVEMVIKSNSVTGRKKANSISQSIYFHPMEKKTSINIRYSVFFCPEFDMRIYEFENDLPGAFSIPFYYGSGSRFYTNINYKISRNISGSLKYSKSLLNESESNNSEEIKIQVRFQFR